MLTYKSLHLRESGSDVLKGGRRQVTALVNQYQPRCIGG